MAAPTALTVYVDKAEYSRIERKNDTIVVTVNPQGTGLDGETVEIELRKARRNRDVVVAYKTLTLRDEALQQSYTETFHLPDILEAQYAIPKVRSGKYFIRARAVNAPSILDDSPDFRVAFITLDRMRNDWMKGVLANAFDVMMPRFQPKKIAGVEIASASQGHPRQWFPLTYIGPVGDPVLAGTVDAGATATVIPWTGGGLTVDAHAGQWLTIRTEHRKVASNTAGGLTVEPGFSFIPSATEIAHINQNNQQRALSWCKGPAVPLVEGTTDYVLRMGGGDRLRPTVHFIEVRVPVWSDLALKGESEEILITGAEQDLDYMRDTIDETLDFVQKTLLDAYLEPTRVTTQIDPGTAVAGSDIPVFAGADWDEIVPAITHEAPQPSHWIFYDFPTVPIRRIEEMYGQLVGTRVVEVPEEWIQFHPSGMVELVPYLQVAPQQLLGVQWGFILRGHTPVPNFWHFTAIVGFDTPPGDTVELVGKLAASKLLTQAGQAFRGGFAGESFGRDGVSQSKQYTSSAMYGIFSATVTDYERWVDNNLERIRNRVRGLMMGTLG